MKKLILAAAGLYIGVSAMAQEGKILEAYEYRSVYLTESRSGNADVAIENLLKAKNAIDIASTDERTATKSKTWKRKFDVYFSILSDTSKSSRLLPFKEEAIKTCIEANKKARTIEVNEKNGKPKIFEEGELDIYSQVLAKILYMSGYEAATKEFYAEAGEAFELAHQVYGDIGRPDTASLTNAFISYTNAASSKEEYRPKAIELGNKIVSMKIKDAPLYNSLSKLHIANGDTTQALQVIKSARSEFPNEPSFITSEFNIYIEMGKNDLALKALNDALEAYKEDPEMMRDLYFNYGYILDQEKKIEGAREYYIKSYEIDNNFTSALNNLAGTYLEEANPIINDMNNLPVNEVTKYKEMKAKAQVLYKEAAKYLEKVYALEPTDKLKMNLYELYNFLDDQENMKRFE